MPHFHGFPESVVWTLEGDSLYLLVGVLMYSNIMMFGLICSTNPDCGRSKITQDPTTAISIEIQDALFTGSVDSKGDRSL